MSKWCLAQAFNKTTIGSLSSAEGSSRRWTDSCSNDCRPGTDRRAGDIVVRNLGVSVHVAGECIAISWRSLQEAAAVAQVTDNEAIRATAASAIEYY